MLSSVDIITCNAKKIRQTHKIDSKISETLNKGSDFTVEKRRIKVEAGTPTVCILADSTELTLSTDSIRMAGYDKPLTSNKEAFHLINSTGTAIIKVGVRIIYLDLKNRMFHSRELPVEVIVPAGETRLVSIPSWDIQKSFYYYLGQEPKKVATPYKVKIDIMWAEFDIE